jgi:hypothetical protein
MAELPDDIVEAARKFRQGDVVAGIPLIEVADLRRPLGPFAKKVAQAREEADQALGITPVRVNPETGYVCLVSQTCDVVSPSISRPSVRVAQVVAHKDPASAQSKNKRRSREERIQQYKDGKLIHCVHLDIPHADFAAGGYVDLQSVTTVEKTLLLDKTPLRTLTTHKQRKAFSFRCGHIHDRPAIPAPFDDYVVRPLRKYLDDLKANDPGTFKKLDGAIEDEWIWLDDPDSEAPTIGQLWLVGDTAIPDEVKSHLDEWWEEVAANLPAGASLLENRYETLEGVSYADGHAMSLLTYWYLSDDSLE